jgi:predicted enzyme related to lactoylglutathione lyase
MVTGLGGVFIKAYDPKFLARWYEDNLGIYFGTALYFSFKWREMNQPENIAHTVFSFFRDDTTYFYPGTNDLMINLRVNDLDDLRIRLKIEGVYVEDKIESYEYGRFGWAMDPAGNKLELWEPIDSGFEDQNKLINLDNVTSFGGVFLKCPNPESLMKWYSKNFGLFFSYSSHTFQWKDLVDKEHTGHTVLSFFTQDSSYFEPSMKNYMLNFRVKNLHGLMENLKSSGAELITKTEEFEYGKFGWIVDPEGNKIELWEPVDEKFNF